MTKKMVFSPWNHGCDVLAGVSRARPAVSRALSRSLCSVVRAQVDDNEIEQIRFAFQMVRGTLNNTLLNQPGPLQLEDAAFRSQMERAFQLVAGIE
jgi:hypothetical protein